MAHFALVDQNNIVVNVSKISNDVMLDSDGNESEQLGIDFLNKITPPPQNARWIQTSYNSSFRGNYAGIGMKYYEEYDMFLYDKPYESWILIDAKWEPPIERPEPNLELGYAHHYDWDEDNIQWQLVRDPEVKPIELPEEGYYWKLPEGEYDWIQEEIPPAPETPALPGYEYVFDYNFNVWVQSEIQQEGVEELPASETTIDIGSSENPDTNPVV